MNSIQKYIHRFGILTMSLSIVMFLSFEGKAQIKTTVKDSLHIVTTHFSRVTFKDSVKSKPAYKYTYKTPVNELMFFSNYPLTSAQIEQRQKVEEHRKLLPTIAESVVESYINSKKKKRAAVVPAF